jgi:hypothetical protein
MESAGSDGAVQGKYTMHTRDIPHARELQAAA